MYPANKTNLTDLDAVIEALLDLEESLQIAEVDAADDDDGIMLQTKEHGARAVIYWAGEGLLSVEDIETDDVEHEELAEGLGSYEALALRMWKLLTDTAEHG